MVFVTNKTQMPVVVGGSASIMGFHPPYPDQMEQANVDSMGAYYEHVVKKNQSLQVAPQHQIFRKTIPPNDWSRLAHFSYPHEPYYRIACWREYNYTIHPDTPPATDPHLDHVYTYPLDLESEAPIADEGPYPHSESEKHAVDFLVPVGTKVLAAREGIVIGLYADSTVVGGTSNNAAAANFIHILHDDGTVGTYFHLDTGGVFVTLGQSVKAGDVIGLSGNTGKSSEPHLHFHVSTTLHEDDPRVKKSGQVFETLPILMKVPNGPPRYMTEPKATQLCGPLL